MTNKFFSSVDGNHLGIASDFTPRFLRLDSLSIVSRQSDLRTYSAESSCETFSVGQSSPLAFPFKAKSQLAFSRQSVLPILLLCLTLFIGTGQMWGEGTETFEGITSSSSSYGSVSWTGVNGQTWSAVQARTDNKITGTYGLTFNKQNSRTLTMTLTAAQKNAGIGTLSFNYKFPFSDSGKSNTLTLTIGSDEYSSGALSYTSSKTAGQITVNAIPSSTSITITITGGGRICVDDFSWTSCSSCSSKTLSSISVQTAPTKVKYVAGETFDPTGLIITRNYSSGSPDTYTYASHTSEFSFTPSTSTALTTSNTSVSITYGGKSVSQSINVYNVTMQARDEDGNTIPAGGPGAPSRTGKSITPAADANNYVFKEWSISGASLGSSKTTKSNTITSPTGAVTVTAVYHKPITITYKANGQDFTTQTYGYGGTLAFPASEPDGDDYSCTGKTFTGWVAEANKDYKHASTAPTYATASGSVTTEATYYAVFADAAISSGGDATLTINSTSAGTTYDSSDRVINGITMKATNNWSKQSTSGNNYVQIKTNGVVYNGTQLTGYIKSIAITQYGGSGKIYVGTSQNPTTNETTISSTTLNYTQSNNYTYFAIKSTSTLQLTSVVVTYSTSSVTYSNYETNCCTPLVSINGSFNRYHLKIFHHIIMSMFISLIF